MWSHVRDIVSSEAARIEAIDHRRLLEQFDSHSDLRQRHGQQEQPACIFRLVFDGELIEVLDDLVHSADDGAVELAKRIHG